jgi:predicted DNA-binding WGR domain protein
MDRYINVLTSNKEALPKVKKVKLIINRGKKETKEETKEETTETKEEINDDTFKNYTRVQMCDEKIEERTWCFDPMFCDDVSGKMRFWQIGFNGKELVIVRGTVDGKKTLSFVDPSQGQGDTLCEKALLKARSRILKKMRKKGYHNARSGIVSDPKAMEAMTWVDAPSLKEAKSNPDLYGKYDNHWKIITDDDYPVMVEPKYDGIRLLSKRLPNRTFIHRSRGVSTYTHLTHLESDLNDLFDYLPEGSHLDGELYKHGLPLNIISGIVRATVNINPEIKELKYYIFDIITPTQMLCHDRYLLLKNAFSRLFEDKRNNLENILESNSENKRNNLENSISPQVRTNSTLVLTSMIIAKEKLDIFNYFNKCILEGYEGVMIRKNTYYESKRSNNLLKCKSFKDEEGEIIGVREGTGDQKGLAVFDVRDPRGNILGIVPRGTFEERREWFNHPQLVLGKDLKYKYQDLSEYNVPRFAVGITIRLKDE